MISGTNLDETTNPVVRPAAVKLLPKRRSKLVCDAPVAGPAPVQIVPVFSRRPRMKRSGPMSLQLRNGSTDQGPNTVRISPEILSAFGTLSGNGFDATPGTWSFTSSNANGTPQSTFGFQTQTAAVPEPGTLALLAVGAVGLASSPRRRAKS